MGEHAAGQMQKPSAKGQGVFRAVKGLNNATKSAANARMWAGEIGI